MFASSGNWMCTFRGNMLRACAFDAGGGWFDVAELPGGPNVGPLAIQGFAGPSVWVLDSNNALWHCGLPRGDWVQDIGQPPAMSHSSILWVLV